MRQVVRVAALVTAFVLAWQAPSIAADDSSTMVTVVGKISKSNRPGFDAFRDPFFGHHDQKFTKAFAFDRTAVAALPQRRVTARAEGWPTAVAGSGPRLADVLAAAGVADEATVTLVALDGYAVELDPAERRGHDWVLAIDADGAALGIGGRGPAWLLYDSGGGSISPDDEAMWVWSVFLIVAE